jgi:hypothetical protein
MVLAILTEVQLQRFFIFGTRWRQVIDVMTRPIWLILQVEKRSLCCYDEIKRIR